MADQNSQTETRWYVPVINAELRLGSAIKFYGMPNGDLRYIAAIAIRRQDVPSDSVVMSAASGKLKYTTVRLSIFIDNRPVHLHLAIDPHRAMASIDREYLYPTDYMPFFRPTFFKNAYNAVLDRFHQIALNTLPGDTIFLAFSSGKPFSGEIRIS